MLRRWMCGLILGSLALAAHAADVPPPATQPATPGGAVIYADATGSSAANVTQVVLSSTTQTTFTAVERIELVQDVFVVHWAHGAVTLLPRQFVINVTINKKTDRPAGP